MRPACLHIGLAKAASTTLQNAVFRKHPDINYLGKNAKDQASEKVLRSLCIRERDQSLATDWIQVIQQTIRKGQDRNLAPLYSEEFLSTYNFIDPAIYIKRWHAIAPNARILFIIQNPVQWLTSLFYFLLASGDEGVLLGFEAWIDKFVGLDQLRSHARAVFYSDIYNQYGQVFSKEQILVLPVELIRKDAGTFCDKAGAHFNIDIDSFLTTVHKRSVGKN